MTGEFKDLNGLPVLDTWGIACDPDDQYFSYSEANSLGKEACADTGATIQHQPALGEVNGQSACEQGATPSGLSPDSPMAFERIWDRLACARVVVDGQGSSVDYDASELVLFNAFPLCPQPDPDAMVPKSPLDSPGTERMFVVVKEDSAAVGGGKIIRVDNSASPWTFNPNSMDSGPTKMLETYFKGNEKLLRVRQSSLKLKKGRSARSEKVTIWMYNRSMPHGSSDHKIEEDIWIGIVRKKQPSKVNSHLVTVETPRKR
jgi:hypothetical protein